MSIKEISSFSSSFSDNCSESTWFTNQTGSSTSSKFSKNTDYFHIEGERERTVPFLLRVKNLQTKPFMKNSMLGNDVKKLDCKLASVIDPKRGA